MRTLARAALLAAAATAATAVASATAATAGPPAGPVPVQLGPRPFFLVDEMSEGNLK